MGFSVIFIGYPVSWRRFADSGRPSGREGLIVYTLPYWFIGNTNFGNPGNDLNSFGKVFMH
jgi:hypothetical protein